jgi:sugar transferase (PEP-CTERM/EpsH1 system associated)
MRELLFLSHRLPYPPDKGEKIRAWHMLRHLARDHRAHLGCLVDDPADLEHLPLLRRVCASVGAFAVDPRLQRLRALAGLRPGRPMTLDVFRDRRLQGWVDTTLAAGTVGRILVFSSAMAPYVMSARTMPGPPARRILDMVDVDSEKWRAYAERGRLPMRAVWAREARTLRAFERRAAAAFDRTLLVSEAECRLFAAVAPEQAARAGFVENGVDLVQFAPAGFPDPYPPGGPAIAFTGTMDYWPNVDAVAWFATEVFPALAAARPGLGFHIVGANPTGEVQALARQAGVHVTGRVPDIRPYLAHAACVVAPLRIAQGIQNKVLEAMAMARPLVASPQAFAGIRAIPGAHLLVADGAGAFAASVSAVLDGGHPGLGDAARAAVAAGYAWDATLAKLDAMWDDTTSEGTPPPSRLQETALRMGMPA